MRHFIQYWLWKMYLKKYCMMCDEIYMWQKRKLHRRHGCFRITRIEVIRRG